LTKRLRVVTSRPEGTSEIDREGFRISGRGASLGPAASRQLAAFLGEGVLVRVFNLVDEESHVELVGCVVLRVRRDDEGYSLSCLDVVPSKR
jgi:hypothetical protein